MSEGADMTPEEALQLGKELLNTLDGRRRAALNMIIRMAERGRRPSSTSMKAVEHFRAASDIVNGKG